MKWLKNILFIVFIFIIGIYIGSYIYRNKKIETKDVFGFNTKIYLIQYGVYSDIESMKEIGSNLPEYFYYNDEKGYHIIIGITMNKELVDKIKESYGINEVYLKERDISNSEFIENLKQYDILINSLNDKKAIIEAEKQILSKYEEIILKNG